MNVMGVLMNKKWESKRESEGGKGERCMIRGSRGQGGRVAVGTHLAKGGHKRL
jgi:hypothetical protein